MANAIVQCAHAGKRWGKTSKGKKVLFVTGANTGTRLCPINMTSTGGGGGIAVLRSLNYLFSPPAPPLSPISAPAPAPPIYGHLKVVP